MREGEARVHTCREREFVFSRRSETLSMVAFEVSSHESCKLLNATAWKGGRWQSGGHYLAGSFFACEEAEPRRAPNRHLSLGTNAFVRVVVQYEVLVLYLSVYMDARNSINIVLL
jgi:hypothetical protein